MTSPMNLSAETVLNEYHNRMHSMVAESVRHSALIRILEEDRNRAWARVEELENELRGRGDEKEAVRIGTPPRV